MEAVVRYFLARQRLVAMLRNCYLFMLHYKNGGIRIQYKNSRYAQKLQAQPKSAGVTRRRENSDARGAYRQALCDVPQPGFQRRWIGWIGCGEVIQ